MNEQGRASDRFDIGSIELIVHGQVYTLTNISTSGLLVKDYHDAPKVGAALEMIVRVPVMDSVVPLEVAGMVVRDDQAGNVAINYAHPSRTWTKLLEVLSIKEGGV